MLAQKEEEYEVSMRVITGGKAAGYREKQSRRLHTVDEILALPEGKRAELINGRWYDMAAPSTTHQQIVSMLTTELNLFIRGKGKECRVFPAPYAVYLKEDQKNYLEPDILVVCEENREIIKEDGVHGAPDLVVEIVSPSTADRDYLEKLKMYQETGVREYWIIDHHLKIVNQYCFDLNIPADSDEEQEAADGGPEEQAVETDGMPEEQAVDIIDCRKAGQAGAAPGQAAAARGVVTGYRFDEEVVSSVLDGFSVRMEEMLV